MSVSDALKPPPGQVVDYVNSESIGHRIVDASLSTIILATTAVVLRLIVKLRITKSPGWDDGKLLSNLATPTKINERQLPWYWRYCSLSRKSSGMSCVGDPKWAHIFWTCSGH